MVAAGKQQNGGAGWIILLIACLAGGAKQDDFASQRLYFWTEEWKGSVVVINAAQAGWESRGGWAAGTYAGLVGTALPHLINRE